MSNRTISWAAALRDLKSDRQRRNDVREERLKTTAGLRGAPALPLSAWRGRSGRRYVVGVHPIVGLDADEVGEAVCIAVERGTSGIAEPISVVSGLDADTLRRWTEKARSKGATEVHVHRLADNAAERSDIISDLKPGV
ncbi:hypothetical protein ABIE45_004570 [Methylobacterium sp. OAE515]|uniref:hypothetical protein n=1 Tax=Methylobacterium sp. OAE515 TaxID=2817895 RepID=UPI00178A67C8